VQVLLEWIGRATLRADADDDKPIVRPAYPRWAPQNRPWVGSSFTPSGQFRLSAFERAYQFQAPRSNGTGNRSPKRRIRHSPGGASNRSEGV